MAYLESAAFALAISGRPVGAAQRHLDGALCRDDRALEMTKVVENSSSHVIQPVFAYRPTKIQPNITYLHKKMTCLHEKKLRRQVKKLTCLHMNEDSVARRRNLTCLQSPNMTFFVCGQVIFKKK